MSNLLKHAERELDLIGMTADAEDEMNRAMREHLLKMVELFAAEGHSGFSAGYAIGALKKLLAFEPLGPLTGADDEWVEVGTGVFQNNRCSRVFKDATGAYDIDGIVFEEPNGSRYTNRDSRVRVTFPYTPKTEIRKG